MSNLSKEAANQKLILSKLKELYLNIDDRCLNYLGGKEKFESYIYGLTGGQPGSGNAAGDSLVAHDSFNTKTVAAITGSGGTNILAGYSPITFKYDGAFFKGGFTVNNGVESGVRPRYYAE